MFRKRKESIFYKVKPIDDSVLRATKKQEISWITFEDLQKFAQARQKSILDISMLQCYAKRALFDWRDIYITTWNCGIYLLIPNGFDTYELYWTFAAADIIRTIIVRTSKRKLRRLKRAISTANMPVDTEMCELLLDWEQTKRYLDENNKLIKI